MQTKAIRNILIGLAILVGVIVTGVLVTASIWPTLNRVETGKTVEYAELLPKTYQLGYDRVYDEVVASMKAQEEWVFVSDDRGTGVVVATATMPVTGWEHTITARVEKRSDFVSRVYVTSEGDDAPGDLGQNARNIQQLFDELDSRLSAAEVK